MTLISIGDKKMAVTPIFSYTPQNATLIAGMLVGYSTATADPDSNSGTWSPWNGITEIGDIGNSGAFVEQTTLADTTKRYMAGMKDTAEMEVTYYKYAGDTNQAALKTAAEAGSNIWVKVQWKNGDTAKFQAAISGYALVGGSNEDGVKAKISMRINGDVTFTDAS